MSSQLLEPLANISSYGVWFLVAAAVVLVKSSQPSKLDAIPTVGSSGWLGSWWAGIKYLNNALDVIQEGYEKHKGAPFKIATFDRWMVIFTGQRHLEEMRDAPDDTLSNWEGINDELQVKYIMGSAVYQNPYHIPILRTRLTRNIGAFFPPVWNEVTTAFDDVLNLKGGEWKSVTALHTMEHIISRASNRLFVGLPLCRHPDWIDLNLQYAKYAVQGAIVVRWLPSFLKPSAVQWFTKIPKSHQVARKLLAPIIEERRRYLSEYGKDWAEKPNDLLMWLMEESKGPEMTVESLTTRMLVINFASTHTSATSITNVLFYLAAYPQYAQPLREEIKAVIREDGWSKAALDKMQKVDSFIKETGRLESLSAVTLIRKVLKDYTFSDGTFVPKGSALVAATRSIQFDEAFYPNARAFEPFRFADLRREDDDGGKHQYVSTTTEYLIFGLGRRACPGRFFASMELKAILAHIVMTYDVKLEGGAPRPQARRIGVLVSPDPHAKVLFRKRVE